MATDGGRRTEDGRPVAETVVIDLLRDGSGHYSLVGGACRDKLDGGDGHDTLMGGEVDDIFSGGLSTEM